MNFVTPLEWGATVNYDQWHDTPHLKDSLVIHWGGNPQPTWRDGVEAEKRILRGWEDYHLSKGWRGIAYGYALGHSGTLYRLRGRNNYGAHQGDIDHDGITNNQEEIPLVLIQGQGGITTPLMWQRIGELHQWLEQQPWTDHQLNVYGHKEIQPKPTACPGVLNLAGIHEGKWKLMPDETNAEWIRRTKAAYTFTKPDALDVAFYQGHRPVWEAMNRLSDEAAGIAGWTLLLTMELREDIS